MHLIKFRKATVQNARVQSNMVGHGTASASIISQAVQNLACPLAIDYQDVKIPGVPRVTLAGIWSKAEAIVSKSSAIVNAPGSDDSKLVESKSGKRPHFVTKEKSGRFTCDDGCKMWLSTRICSHIAVVHTINLLSSFVDWRKTYKGTPVSLSGIILSDTPKVAGKKAERQRRDTVNLIVEK